MDVGQTRENRLRPYAAKRNMALNHPGALIYEVDIVHVDYRSREAGCGLSIGRCAGRIVAHPQIKKGPDDRPFLFGGEGEIRTHVPELPDHPISSRRRYDHFGTSPVNLKFRRVYLSFAAIDLRLAAL